MITALVIKKMGLENHSLVEKSSSRLGGKNLKFESKNGEVVFLKIGEGVAAESLAREKNALEWLKNKGVNVPKVLNYFVDRSDGTKYLLLSALDGLAVHKITNMDRKEILRIVATALKQFHSISMSGSGKLRTLDDDLIHIQTNCPATASPYL